jgi:hypothetical protein
MLVSYMAAASSADPATKLDAAYQVVTNSEAQFSVGTSPIATHGYIVRDSERNSLKRHCHYRPRLHALLTPHELNGKERMILTIGVR